MKKFLIAVGVVALLSGMWTVLSAQSSMLTSRNNGASAVIKGGAFNQAELNKGLSRHSDAKQLYKKLGIPTNLSGAKNGVLHPDGTIKVGNKVVATGAQSYGRSNGKFHTHSARSAFLGKSTPVFVFLNKDGTFKAAFAKICGNPIVAKPKYEPEVECKNLDIQKVSRTSFKFNATYSAKHASHKSTKYIVKDGNGKVVQSGSKATFDTTKPGKYTVTAEVTFTLKGSNKTKTVTGNCKGSFVVEDKKIEVCDIKTGKTVTIGETQFDSKKHTKDFDYCKEIEVCEVESGKIVTIRKSEFNKEKHSHNFDDCKEMEVCELETGNVVTIRKTQFNEEKHSLNFDDCEELQVCELETGKVVTIRKSEFNEEKHSENFDDCEYMEVCEVETKEVVTIRKSEFDESKHSTDLADCEEVVEEEPEEEPVVTELPQTGSGSLVNAGVALGSLVAAFSYYVASRRS